jgi:hypothetical protein
MMGFETFTIYIVILLTQALPGAMAFFSAERR